MDDFPDDSFNELNLTEADYQKLLDKAPVNDLERLRTGTQHAGFDSNVGDSWIYPNNLPMRAYQYSITQAALYRNTLVVLPTGLGKTFIAAVVMYNLYRWYPTGKVIFMAPTRPLVAQQIEACQRIMPFPLNDTVELTGKLAKSKRIELWRSKRVFFATPQVVQSDIVGDRDGNAVDFPFQQVKLLVIDEAHKAKGRYAYSEVTQTIFGHNRYFRVVALSATPGRTMEDVAEVCRNLFISHVEVRWDTSIDVVSYVHQRSMKTITVPLGDEISTLRTRLLDIIDPYLRQLIEADVLSGALKNLNRNFLLFEQKRFRERSQRERHPQYSTIASNFSMCISLYHALELLERHGLRVFVNSFEDDADGKGKFVLMDRRLRDLVDEVKQRLGPNPFDVSAQAMTNGCIAPMPADLDFGHPKYEEARKCILAHFEAHPTSRAIIFCEYRESVMLIYRLLLQHVPLLKPRCFVGQGVGTSAGSMRALTQKQQLKTMQDFRTGASNILVATSIGEEGIDVGEVELIVCFDISSSNPTRFIQRIGRTGRKKNGNVVMLVTEGREAQLLKEVLVHKDQINKKILQSRVVKDVLYQHAPRMVPTEFNPKCVQTYIEPDKPAAAQPPEAKKAKTKKTKKCDTVTLQATQDLRNFFKKTQPPALDEADCEIFEAPTRTPSAELSTQVRERLRKSVGIEAFLKPPDTQPPPPAAVEPPKVAASADPQRLRKLNRFLQSSKPLLSEAQRNIDIQTRLKSKILNKNNKLQLLRQHYAWVQEICTQMDVLQALDISTNEMAAEEQKIRNDYELILAQFDDVEELKDFLATKPSNDKHSDDDKDKQFDLNALAQRDADAEFNKAYACIFEGLAAPDICVDNFDFIANVMKTIEKNKAERKLLEQSLNSMPCEASMVFTNATLTSEEYEEHERSTEQALADSKYQSQWSRQTVESDKSANLERSGTLTQAFRRQTERKAKELSEVGNSCVDITKSSESSKASALDINDNEELNAMIEATEAFERQQYDSRVNTPLLKAKHCSTPLAKSACQANLSGMLTVEQLIQRQYVSTPIQHAKLENCSTPKLTKTVDTDAKDLVKQTTKESTTSTKGKTSIDIELLSELDKDMDIFMSSFELAQLETKPSSPQTTTKHTKTERDSMLAELALNMDDFLEPLPEEKLLTQTKTTVLPPNARKENLNSQTKLLELPKNANKPTTHSPNLFDETISPVRPLPVVNKSLSLAAKLATKCKPNALRQMATESMANNILKSPQNRLKTDNKKYEKSPSVFDMYLNKMSGNGTTRHEQSTLDGNESVIGLPRRINAKRKIIDSDSDAEAEKEEKLATAVKRQKGPIKQQEAAANESDSDFECIPETQMLIVRNLAQRKKRRKFNSFIDCEAAQSGSDNGNDSEQDAEHTIGAYIKDSVIVSSGDEDSEVDEAARSHVQAMYLQAARSPHMRRGAFKIPEPRVFNDTENIFSQTVEPDSHYIPDSFVVNEAEEDEVNVRKKTRRQTQDVSMCPLERAERILKAQRRQRRQQKRAGGVEGIEYAPPNANNGKRRRIRCITVDSSSDEE